MKKIVFMALAAIALATVSCNRTPSANVKSDIDTLSYALGISQAQGLKMYLFQNGLDSTYMDEFYKGLMEGANTKPDDKKKAAYMLGNQIGMQISQQMVPGINKDLFGADSTQTISKENFVAALVTGLQGKEGLMTPEEAQTKFEALSTSIKAKQYESTKQEGADFMKKYASAKDVKKLDCGVLYKVLKEGKGAIPTDSSTVTVHYEGKTIAGKVFDSSYKREQPQQMRADQVIKGWTEVLKNMPVGSKWEVVIPAELAYGERGAGNDIAPYSTLIFTIELISLDK